jgi:hypothetical protein
MIACLYRADQRYMSHIQTNPQVKLLNSSLFAKMDFLAWRDAQMAAISTQLEDALPALIQELSEQVDAADIFTLVKAAAPFKAKADRKLQDWKEAQAHIALARAETALDSTLAAMSDEISMTSDVWDTLAKTIPAAAGFGLIAVSVAAIPTVVSFATITTSTFAIFSTATISWPLFAVGTLVIGTAAALGSTSLLKAQEKARERLKLRVIREAERSILGIGQKPGARCLLNDIQAAVLLAGQNRIGEKQ